MKIWHRWVAAGIQPATAKTVLVALAKFTPYATRDTTSCYQLANAAARLAMCVRLQLVSSQHHSNSPDKLSTHLGSSPIHWKHQAALSLGQLSLWDQLASCLAGTNFD